MASASKLIMVATVVMVISLAVIISLLLLLLADLYCSLLLNRRRQRHRRHLSTSVNRQSISSSPLQGLFSPPQPLRTHFYSQGVLQPPRNLLFPSIPAGNLAGAGGSDIESRHFQLVHFLKPIQNDDEVPVSRSNEEVDEARELEDLVYISNPMYDNGGAAAAESEAAAVDTPFETPETSPSNLGNISGEEDGNNTPPLTAIKVPEKACSVSMKEGRFMVSSGSESMSSSSSTGTPCTSPSW
ncbi:uncharacterized protein LOC124911219 [Impatiens glandulifera]|uniref:uncharacterized protein LOC124911219 n=1 Tax=Impatiens glandulifera TaxID=253017 RepID=UPI001FB119B4|nr:uncharacterized protein LOC124911219 [Impatiens glandulifera]